MNQDLQMKPTSNKIEIRLESQAETNHLGLRIGKELFDGATIGFVGPMGAGKTTLIGGICEGLGVSPRSVSSPTFILVQEYKGRLPVYHLDVSRLQSNARLEDLGIHEVFTSGKGV
ncbi:MAG: tRNA (adenosine(37)-N6)-threonylcarbamoyltransferase complex ATPase subunit type 1 TsaE, partial [Gemmataceae bacterium]